MAVLPSQAQPHLLLGLNVAVHTPSSKAPGEAKPKTQSSAAILVRDTKKKLAIGKRVSGPQPFECRHCTGLLLQISTQDVASFHAALPPSHPGMSLLHKAVDAVFSVERLPETAPASKSNPCLHATRE